jgi:dATP pyrophosphohydrolase
VWQPVTGGIERGESAMRAAVREVREETGLVPLRWWALEHMANFYDVARDHVRVVPVFAAEVAWTDPVHLSDEHDRYAFVTLEKAWERVLWATQRRALEALAEEVLSGSAGGAAREITARVATLAKPAARRTRKTTARASRVQRSTSRTAASRRTKRA